ncbi:Nodulation protein D 2 [Marinibacterium anthonyi]|nr:Nodulation protein D 2 [Marinibacterium anthonyi]
MTGLDLNLLNSLHALLETGSVTRAADRLGISQSAMSYNLARLRKAMGDELFTRTAGGLDMTPYARTLGDPLSRIMTDIDRLVSRSVAFDPASAERTFTIALPDASEVLIVPEILRRLGIEAPGIRLVLRNVEDIDVLLGLDTASLDMAIGVFSEGQLHHKRKLLHKDDYLCLFNPLLLDLGSPISMEEYLGARHVALSGKMARNDIVGTHLALRDTKRTVAMTTEHLLSIPHIVHQTPVLATVHGRLARYFARQLGLRTSLPPFDVPPLPISLLWHSSNDPDPGHMWMRDLIYRALKTVKSREKDTKI